MAEGLVSALVVVRGPDRVLRRVLDDLGAQSHRSIQIIVVHPWGDADVARRQLPAGAPPCELVACDATFPGALAGAGLAAARGELVMVCDGGEALRPAYVERAVASLLADPGLSFATTAVEPRAPDVAPRGGTRADVEGVVASPFALPAATVVRRAALVDAGGWDASLPALPWWDLWLTLLRRGAAGIVLQEPLLARTGADDVMLLGTFRDERYLPALSAIYAKHAALFQGKLPEALEARESTGRAIWLYERELTARREAALAELDSIRDELAAIGRELESRGRGLLEWADLRRTEPVSPFWGFDRGRPVDRHYIEGFVASHRGDIRGRVLEMQDAGLTQRFGSDVERVDALDVDPSNLEATRVDDLRSLATVPDATYDCVLLTQTLHLVPDPSDALRSVHRVLRPGGVLVGTVPALSRLALELGPEDDHLRFTAAAVRRLLAGSFPSADVEVRAYGNVLAATAFLQGLACEDLTKEELDAEDPALPVVVAFRAMKPAAVRAAPRRRGAAILLYHRITDSTDDPYGICLAPALFREHLRRLVRDHRVVPLQEIASALSRGEVLEGAVAVTLDDGHTDDLHQALPILQDLGVPATFFLTTEGLDHDLEYWWDTVHRVLRDAPRLPDPLEVRLRERVERLSTSGKAARQEARARLHAWMKGLEPAERDHVLRQLVRHHRESPGTGPRPMRRAEVLELARSEGAAVGAHSVHHVSLPAITPKGRLAEVLESRVALERLHGRPVTAFAYPFGDFSAEVVGDVRRAGFTVAVTVEGRGIRASDDLLELPRVNVEPMDGDAFSRLVQGLLYAVEPDPV